ncbi:UDP-N-acetylmuramoyl-tripeptide--D-alanyl-D-alanine ligase [Terracoccus luteus]|uniref:UDP-N-acetylmuramoyl-tripeptide--D-alanyl-D-alanine ligase n=1 Tax=Terracoccus luteus TaxID=53356 RepID=A0A839PV51_9MICO|nr:UDP-N-acetylmuramoyl-tripeptide--D-alanyl-D-alanine ligase [Terracoccus luteus]MBB2987129.1 UDP-N-acetylmuramoyl-tripeptide--D-alanyl-D-alanine ligase [Terracoccus luteus]MCP2172780.1 UDP-N-acetylmuramoyl-tripeptide--D-alanyl-D-alanine ligase [Terracoccus luteus]
MIPLRLDEVAEATGGVVHGCDDPASVLVDGPVTTDSRECGPGGLYVARVGEHADGHDYVPAALAAGAVAVLGSRPVDGVGVVVDDVQEAFGRLARVVVDRAVAGGLHVVGITGSSGKTSTKDLLASVLAGSGETVAPVNSLNGEIGVPLTVCRVTPTTRHLVVEMGARGVGHIDYLTRIAPPAVAVVLNVGSAHVGEFGSRENIARAKSELPRAVAADGLSVLNADDPLVRGMADGLASRVVLVGTAPDADVRATGVTLDPLGRARFTLDTAGGSRPVTLRQSGAHHVGNALAVAAVALELGVGLDDVAHRLSEAVAVSRWRMEVTERPDGVTVVNDAYNANPESMLAALEALAAIETDGRRWAVLGSMLELGEDADAEHAALLGHATRLGVDEVVAVGDGARAIGVPTWVPDRDAAHDLLADRLRPGDVVLLKSSRDSGLRWLGDRLAGTGEYAPSVTLSTDPSTDPATTTSTSRAAGASSGGGGGVRPDDGHARAGAGPDGILDGSRDDILDDDRGERPDETSGTDHTSEPGDTDSDGMHSDTTRPPTSPDGTGDGSDTSETGDGGRAR